MHCSTSSLFICFGHTVRVKGLILAGTAGIGFHFLLCQEAWLSSLPLFRLKAGTKEERCLSAC